MRVIPGSHLGTILKHEDTFGESNILTRGQQIANVDESVSVDIELRPGQMSLHHAQLVHSSGSNQSNHRRIGVALQAYMPPYVRQTIGENYALIVRGQDTYGNAISLRRPTRDMEPESVKQRNVVNEHWVNILYQGASKIRLY